MSKDKKLGTSASFGAASRARSSARGQLISQATGETPTDPAHVPLDQLAGNPENPRESLGDLEELAASLQQHGLLQPVSVLPRAAFLDLYPAHAEMVGSVGFVVIHGNRRLAAAHLAGLKTLAVHVRSTPDGHDETEVSIRIAALAENIHREDLHPLEEAREIQHLLDKGLKRTEAASALGKSNGWITQRLLLLNLVPELQKSLREGELKLAEARELGKLAPEKQSAEFYAVKDDGGKGGGNVADSHSPQPKESPRQKPRGPLPTPEGSAGPEQLSLDLQWGAPEEMANEAYERLSNALSADDLHRFANAFVDRLS